MPNYNSETTHHWNMLQIAWIAQRLQQPLSIGQMEVSQKRVVYQTYHLCVILQLQLTTKNAICEL